MIKMQIGETALICASDLGHLHVVNRLLDCKEIDVNAQDRVSGIVDFVISHLQNSLPIFFRMCFLIKTLVMIKMQIGETALMEASFEGHLHVVNRLLDCKEVDVNLQMMVSGIVDFVTCHLQNSLPIFSDVFFN